MSGEAVLYDVAGGVATITLNDEVIADANIAPVVSSRMEDVTH